MVWTGGNGAWETASNWSNGLPTSTSTVTFNDSAAISGYSVGLDATETVANVIFGATTKGVFWTVSNDYASNLWNVTSSFVLDQPSAATALATFRNGIIAVTNNAGTATFSVGNYADGGKGLFTMTFKSATGDMTSTNYPTLIANDFLVTSNSTFTLNAGTLTTYGGSIDRGMNATMISFAPSAGAIATWNVLGGTNSITYLGAGGANEFALTSGGTVNVNISGSTTKAIWGGASTDIGWNGAADVTVSGGAVVTNSGNAILSGNGLSSTNNTVTVTGAGSRWSVGNQLEFGAAAGSNSLTVAAGGVVSSFSSLIGQGAGGSNNLVTVTGGNSTWTNTDLVVLGVNAGGNTLIITNGGQFSSSTDSNNYTRLGGSVNSTNNQAIVDGSGSVWNNGGQLQLGSNGVNNTVTIKNGGEMTSTAGLIGMGASSSNNAATVNGANSLWISSGGITVGLSGSSNQLAVGNSGEVITTGLTLSSGASSNNNVLVSGGILVVTNATTNAVLNVGSAGQGSVTFTGGTVVVDDLVVTNTIIGSVLNTNQFIFNSGVLTNRAGSTVSNGLLFVVGDSVDSATLNLLGGSNTFATGLEVTNNGALVINRLAAGHSPTVTMGQLLVNSNAAVTIQSGTLTTLAGATIGRGTNATFDIAPVSGDSVTWNIQGGTNAITYLGTVGTNRLALSTGGTVNINISGPTTKVTLGGAETDIGWNGAVALTVSGGAVLTNSGAAELSRNGLSSSNNNVTVTGAGSQWYVGGQLFLGTAGASNSVTVSSGGVLDSLSGILAQGLGGSNNLVTVTGTNSAWNMTGTLQVGAAAGGNTVVVTNNGELAAAGMTLSSGSSSNNMMLLAGGILVVTNAATNAVVNVGSVGKGTLTFSGGAITLDNLVVTNTITGSILNTNQFIFNSGVLTNRAGSTVSNGLLFVVGDSVDAATLNLLGGTNTFATGVEVTNNGALVINRLAAGHSPTVTMGQLLVNSNAAVTIQSGTLTTLAGATIGRGTNATFDIAPVSGDSVTWNLSGGTNAITYLGTVGTNRLALTSGGTVTVNVSGSTTKVTLGGAETDIGWNGAVGMTVSGGAVLTNSGNAFLSRNGLSSTNNTVTVTGAGSQWNVGGELQVGAAGPSNSMTISAGGEVSSAAGRLGSASSSSNNLVVVTGTNSLWQTSSILGIGEQANAGNSLIISNGGEVLNLGTITRMGLNTNGNNNSLIVDGAGSQMVFTNNSMVVGNFGLSNNMTLKNGGLINGGAVIVGDGAGSSFNSILVTGTNSLWLANTGIFQVGLGGSGNQVTVSNDAQVSVMGDGGLQISTGATSNNSVLVSGGILVVTNASANAVLNVGSAGAGTFTLNGGSVTANQLLLTNGTGSVFIFNSGTLNTDSAYVSNSAPIVVGNGVAAATWNMQGGEHSLASGLGVSALAAVAVNAATLDVSGTVTNSGTLSMINSVGHFSGPVVNSGAWITDPTTNTFADTYTVTSSGYIAASAGDVYEFQKSFVNQSTQSNSWNTLNVTPGSSGSPGTTFVFDGNGATGTQQFFQAGLQLTGGFNGSPVPGSNGVQSVTSYDAVQGFETNFALGTLDIGNADTNSIVMLSSSFDSGSITGALFVNDLDLYGASELIISNNMELYFVSSSDWTMSNIKLLGNGGIHQLQEGQSAVVPEPGVLLLWVCGVGVVYAARRRTGKRAACLS
jgi:T5SS/PEP-CTERM-associated repeat protein